FSATRHRADPLGLGHNFFFLQRQAVFAAVGAVIMLVTAAVDYRWMRDFAPMIYGGTLLLLAGVKLVGQSTNGAQAWYQLGPFQLQPSEFAKVALIICLGGYCAANREDFGLRNLVTVLAMAAVP